MASWWDRFRGRRALPVLPGPEPEHRGDAPGATVQNALTYGGVANVDKGASNVLSMRTPWYWTELETVYRQMGLAYRITNAFPRAAVAAGWCVDRDEERDVGAGVDEDLNIRENVLTAAVDARLYGMACLLMVTSRDPIDPYGALNPDGPLTEPMGDGEVVEQLQEYAAYEMAPIRYGQDPRSPWYREPELWQLSPMDGLGGPVLVHASRLVTFSGAKMTRRIRRQWYGRDFSILEMYRDALLRRDRIDGAAATLSEEMIIKAMKVKGLRALLTGTNEQKMQALDLWQTMARTLGLVGAAVMDSEDTLEVASATATGFDALEQTSRRALSEVEGIPQTQLFGDTPSGLNTDNESGRKAWASRVEEYEMQQLAGPLRTLYARAIGVATSDITVRFLPVEPMTEKERADIELVLANRAATLITAGAVTPEEERERLKQPEPTAQYEIDDSLTDALMTDDPQEPDPNAPATAEESAAVDAA